MTTSPSNAVADQADNDSLKERIAQIVEDHLVNLRTGGYIVEACEAHGREYTHVAEDGSEVCTECAADGWSGEFGMLGLDSESFEIADKILSALTAAKALHGKPLVDILDALKEVATDEHTVLHVDRGDAATVLAHIDRLKRERDEAIDALADMVGQHCYEETASGEWDTGALSANAGAVDTLIQHGRVRELRGVGRMTVFKWVTDARDVKADTDVKEPT